jgi:Sensors of blue-light using FAD
VKTIAYTSRASRDLSSQDVESILRSCRINNALEGITGILIYNGSAFLQVLEGAKRAVDETLARIERDDRHCEIVLRDERDLPVRAFPTWDMAYLHLPNGELLGGEAVRRALDRPVLPEVLALLQFMAQSMPLAGSVGEAAA